MKYIILLEKDGIKESWGSLTNLCEAHPDFSYEYIKSWKFPFKYKGWNFSKLPHNCPEGQAAILNFSEPG
jgi:hypothetical protein